LYNFCSLSNCADGQEPRAGLVQGTDGNFYGTTFIGGSNGSGAVFKITPAGALITLYSFCPLSNCATGAGPNSALVQGANGNFYGTTERGGTGSNCGASGCGVIFEITSSGALTVVHSFDSRDGSVPYAGLLQATDGNFYGTTYVGGTNNGGTVFQLTPGGTLTTLYDFCSLSNCADGTNPSGVLVEGANGNLYGTAGGGGLGGATTSAGVVFQITTTGAMTTLYNFCSLHNCTDGSRPYAGLVLGTNGNLYGTTLGGGVSNHGTAFQVTPSGALFTLYNFCSLSNCTDGWYPYAGLVQATNGNFYGTTYWGGGCTDGTSGCGAIFSFSLNVALPPTIKPASLTFPSQALNTASKAKVVTIKNVNTGSATLDLTGFAISPPFAISANRCKATLAPGKSCSLSITFTPTGAGASTGSLSITDNGPTTPQTVVLKGTGE
ncbi:MAG: choice-of-anchor tandem repeat GloVer-containing protein, partial [Mycobacterium sp.]